MSGFLCGGLYWTRTNDPIDVNDVLYQLSQQTLLWKQKHNSMGERICQYGKYDGRENYAYEM